jgi:hypothetical protein
VAREGSCRPDSGGVGANPGTEAVDGLTQEECDHAGDAHRRGDCPVPRVACRAGIRRPLTLAEDIFACVVCEIGAPISELPAATGSIGSVEQPMLSAKGRDVRSINHDLNPHFCKRGKSVGTPVPDTPTATMNW